MEGEKTDRLDFVPRCFQPTAALTEKGCCSQACDTHGVAGDVDVHVLVRVDASLCLHAAHLHPLSAAQHLLDGTCDTHVTRRGVELGHLPHHLLQRLERVHLSDKRIVSARPRSSFQVQVQCCVTSTETIRTNRYGEHRTATSTFAQLLSSVFLSFQSGVFRRTGKPINTCQPSHRVLRKFFHSCLFTQL